MLEDFVNLDVQSDPVQMEQMIYDAVQEYWPDWTPAEGNLETALTEGIAALAAEISDLISVMGEEVFQWFGQSVANVPPIESRSATAQTTWTMRDDSGYTIQEGWLVGLEKSGDETVAFRVVNEVVVPPGQTTTAAGEVQIAAVIEGQDANGIDGPGNLLDGLGVVAPDGIELVAPTDNGVDAEDGSAYLNRLRQELQLMTPRPILPRDFEILARRDGRIHRAKAVDLWDPSDDSLDNDRFVGIAFVDEDGEEIDPSIGAEVVAMLDTMRETNFVIALGSPTYTEIDVVATVTAMPTFDTAQVKADIESALEDMLSPSRWGLSPFSDDTTSWVDAPKVRWLDVGAKIRSLPGVLFVESLTVDGGTADVTLDGVVPLTRPGTITITVNAG